ncbi:MULTISPECIES: bifunctional DNA-formamidopyrimidine glycosylase/DNA-(apurinic or apyrimidinic site) lyase [unclassified Halomonas]|uniref:bifunctional DNA-formamidopyrimidine glycosylase/DNA-(apurinic or apyrimidinic site) lyase n=1 Tax=unclassified Halomonas TaxID=2609666 RepID=UPI000F5DDF04|nr:MULTISPECIES: bifunctional DNA-formamidopyrimidine glycosylase/DNA-(apurinic or apyrimidinic site) lyase [unclassified Halomonas]MBR9771103.1 bifunctional DNA-formamidopyrimidine glycosylase/DNA-(apurinic or apyrimidinic site) lyase [Gammaproteobacteria bacterium]MCJ8285423.1 bifunctional DNA-formamidopyrimidine glycosylase/DNA-(apurinic or apyrimidinic site) lyase [Halomonas sp.]NQY70830.1 bifunctional DNA-formamidopyrimidine glycosylase/DNA-(apurinic or apyrimidinic site) lyase [Halomonas s
MPELPEVETTRRGIAPHVQGREIREVLVRQSRLRVPVPEDLADRLIGARFGEIRRRAKYLLLPVLSGEGGESVENGETVASTEGTCTAASRSDDGGGVREKGTLLWHLGMSGSLRIARLGELPRKHDHVDLVLEDGVILRYHDPRRFGFVDWLRDDEAHDTRLSRLGPEPLSQAFDGARLYALSRGRQAAVKPFLMDNAVVVGVGNIYASEALFLAGIDPRRAAGRIGRERYDRLAAAAKEVLAAAITQGGTTLRDFVSGTGEPGYFAQRLNVYGRAGAPCRRCGGELKHVTLGQRASVFCPRCQR